MYKWFFDGAYGDQPLRTRSSTWLALYLVAIAIYVGSRIVRRREGIDLGMINSEIPVE